GLVRRFGSPGWAFTRPLAAGLTTLGLAGLLVAALPSGFLGSSAAMPARDAATERNLMTYPAAEGSPPAAPSGAPGSMAAPAPAGSVPAASAVPTPSASVNRTFDTDVKGGPIEAGGVDSSNTPSPGTAFGSPDRLTAAADDDGSEAPTVAARDGSIVLAITAGTVLLVGLGLFALRWAARRIA
ncbi:MAG TPA: hypothetical protein VH813_10400, partial [Candidatus Limnocylindrales bacterium]